MKLFLLCLALGACRLSAAAPDTLAGKVFRVSYKEDNSSRSRSLTDTFVLGNDGRFTQPIATAQSNTASMAGFRITALENPAMGDGTYLYRKTGEATGRLTLTQPVASSTREQTYELTFAAPAGGASPPPESTAPDGTCTRTFQSASQPGSFYVEDLTITKLAPALNISTRNRVTPERSLTIGFVVPEGRPRYFLIRAVGPSLEKFGVTGVWADPDFALFKGSILRGGPEVHYGDWSAPATVASGASSTAADPLRKLFSYAGAFPLVDGAKDAVEVVHLSAGDYTIVCQPAAGAPGGEVLVEVYVLP